MSKKNMESTRELMGTREVTDYSIRTYKNEELVYFLIQPSNISVLSEESLSARIYGLMTVLKGITEIEMMCLNSRENFEDNKRYLKKRMEEETNTVVRKLLEKDANYLDRMQVQMATAREFLLIIRLREKKENEIFSYLNRIEKMLAEQGFTSKRAEEEDIKRILAVYFEQNVTTEKFEEFDGERWIILNELKQKEKQGNRIHSRGKAERVSGYDCPIRYPVLYGSLYLWKYLPECLGTP